LGRDLPSASVVVQDPCHHCGEPAEGGQMVERREDLAIIDVELEVHEQVALA